MVFSPPVVGCLVKNKLAKGGGGHGHPRTPLATPLDLVTFRILSDLKSHSYSKQVICVSYELSFIPKSVRGNSVFISTLSRSLSQAVSDGKAAKA